VIFKPYYHFETAAPRISSAAAGLGECAVVDAHEEDVDAYIAFAHRRACASRT
jgi:hydroxyacylglutathione hydrolase